jgi:hypothetical protein
LQEERPPQGRDPPWGGPSPLFYPNPQWHHDAALITMSQRLRIDRFRLCDSMMAFHRHEGQRSRIVLSSARRDQSVLARERPRFFLRAHLAIAPSEVSCVKSLMRPALPGCCAGSSRWPRAQTRFVHIRLKVQACSPYPAQKSMTRSTPHAARANLLSAYCIRKATF